MNKGLTKERNIQLWWYAGGGRTSGFPVGFRAVVNPTLTSLTLPVISQEVGASRQC